MITYIISRDLSSSWLSHTPLAAPGSPMTAGPPRVMKVHNIVGQLVEVTIAISSGDDDVDYYIATQIQKRVDAESRCPLWAASLGLYTPTVPAAPTAELGSTLPNPFVVYEEATASTELSQVEIAERVREAGGDPAMQITHINGIAVEHSSAISRLLSFNFEVKGNGDEAGGEDAGSDEGARPPAKRKKPRAIRGVITTVSAISSQENVSRREENVSYYGSYTEERNSAASFTA